MNKALVVSGFVTAVVGAAIASGTFTPVAYGAGELSPAVTGTGILGTVMAIVGSVTSFWQVFNKEGGGGKIIQDLGGVLNQPQTPTTITAEVALVALFAICAKSNDMHNISKVSELATSMLAAKGATK